MEIKSLVQLVGSGNTKTVEEHWLGLLEAPELSVEQLYHYDEVLAALVRAGSLQQAEALAWATLEALGSRCAPREMLELAGRFLLAVGDSAELRAAVSELYRKTHGELEGFDALLKEAGLEQGRPVRRALRTLEVCLEMQEGAFLMARDDGGAARVKQIDRSAWEYALDTGRQPLKLGAVHLADRYAPVERNHFSVLRCFFPDELATRLKRDSADTLIELCRQHGNEIDSDQLELMLVPNLMPEEDWKKWFTAARGALRRTAHVEIEGRGPWVIRYHEEAVSPEDDFHVSFKAKRVPEARFAALEAYIRECKQRKLEVSAAVLQQANAWLVEQAQKRTRSQRADAGQYWMYARRAGELAKLEEPIESAREWVRQLTELQPAVAKLKDDALILAFCTTAVEARPDSWQTELAALLPLLPGSACEAVAQRLADTGYGFAEWAPVVNQILTDPVAHFEALLWLWDRPSDLVVTEELAPTTVLSRILAVLEQAQRLENISKEQAKKIGARARAVLGARKRVRFNECLATIDAGLARAWRTQLNRLGNLGRAVREDIVRDISHKFPELYRKPTRELWEQEDVLYVTEAGMTRRRKEIDELVNVKMRENAKAIGIAAEKGDLSENSEYKFALEERDLLRARLAQMNIEVDMAKLLPPENIPTDRVGIGTRTTLERVTDQAHHDFCFLGPWDTVKERRVYNYKTPLAGLFLGKRVGDEVELDLTEVTGTYRIVDLRNELLEH